MSTNASVEYSRAPYAAPAHPRDVSTIAILGAGRVGTALARGLVEAGFDVRVAGPGNPDQISLIVEVVAPGAQALSAADAVAGADLVIVAVPLHKIATVDPSLLNGTLVVDVMNYWEPIDGHIPRFAEAPEGTSAIVARMFPGAQVVKTLNHIGYHDIESDRREPGDVGRRALAVASDHAEAAATVMMVIDKLGFDPIYAGDLADGVVLEAGGGVFGVRLDRDGFVGLLDEGRAR
ncbi:MAG: NADP oxidoreductase [Actinobacteria bacterium HGW-Actinobacteria-4]|nr:MAG: NADP oxidoreductase [Actinobacteria bacterium HGW-Actinobacteria-4]